MAEIEISTLIQRIEIHIRQNRSPQAVALCTHILYYYPKHLEAYSLMAQALAGLGNLGGALDIYRRVLSADPENAGAYAGIAQVFDYRHQVEEAVWHMERAYELAPALPEIRKELLRLYKQSRGSAPERLKLTRGALARLYVQEGLYEQAIREFREIGSTMLSRYDIRAALVEALWRAGRTRDAADTAQSLLDSLPYCLKANLILGAAWQESSIAEGQKYLKRAHALDPSNQVAHRLLGSRSPLNPAFATIPDFVQGMPPPAQVRLDDEEPADALQMEKPGTAATETLLAQPPTIPIPGLVPLPGSSAPAAEGIDSGSEPALVGQSTPAPMAEEESELVPAWLSESTPSPVDEPDAPIAEGIIPQPDRAPFIAPILPAEPGSPSTLADEKANQPSSSQRTGESESKPSVLKNDLPPWLMDEEASPELAALEQSDASTSATTEDDWLPELQKSFSNELEIQTGSSAELIPTPFGAPQTAPPEPTQPQLAQMAAEPAPVQPVAEEKSQTLAPGALAGAPATSKSEPAPAEPTPAWLGAFSPKGTVETNEAPQAPTERRHDWLVESKPVEPAETEEPQSAPMEQTPAWLDRSKPVEPAETTEELLESAPNNQVEAYQDMSTSAPAEPVIAREEYVAPEEEPKPREERSEQRAAKWVEILSRYRQADQLAEQKVTAPATPAIPEPELPVGVEPARAPIASPQLEPPEMEQDVVQEIPESEPEPTSELTPALTSASLLTTPLGEETEPPIVIERTETVVEPVLAAAEPPAPRGVPSAPVSAPALEPIPPAAEPVQDKRQPKYASRLALARGHRDAHRVGEALSEYEFIINKAPRLMPEAIADLEKLVAASDAPLEAFRVLGDAYTRAGRLNDALACYRYVYKKVEENRS